MDSRKPLPKYIEAAGRIITTLDAAMLRLAPLLELGQGLDTCCKLRFNRIQRSQSHKHQSKVSPVKPRRCMPKMGM